MVKNAFSLGRILAVAVGTVLLTVEPAQAQSRGGYHHGGHYGLYHGGHYSRYHGYYRPYYSGHHHYYFRPYFYPYYGNGYGSYGYPHYGSYPSAPAQPTLTVEDKHIRALVASAGVSTDESRLEWPLGLRLLSGTEVETLRVQVQALFQAAATQAARGQPNATVVQEMAHAADKLRIRLLKHRKEQGGLALHTYEEAERFLDRLKGARRLLLVPLVPTPSGAGSEGQGSLSATRG